MSGNDDKPKTQQDKGRNVVVRTDSKKRKKKVEENRANQQPEFNQVMVVEAQGDNISSREIFGKKLIPITGFLKNMTVKVPEAPMELTLHVLTEFGAHKRRDSFDLQPGINTLEEQVEVKGGTVIKFSIEFEGEQDLDEVYLSGILAIK